MYWGGIPIVSLDKIYLTPDDGNIYFIDCTRLDGSRELVSRLDYNDSKNVEGQVKALSEYFLRNGIKEIVLADDVVFSGNVLKTLIDQFANNGIKVVGIRSMISTLESYSSFKSLPLGLRCGYLLLDKVIDQICERDFYIGIAGSGILVRSNDGRIYKSPYFKPYGDAQRRASIPSIYEDEFSRGCLDRSIMLWEEIEKLSGRSFDFGDLPEEIINTDRNENVVKTLKKERGRL